MAEDRIRIESYDMNEGKKTHSLTLSQTLIMDCLPCHLTLYVLLLATALNELDFERWSDRERGGRSGIHASCFIVNTVHNCH